MEKAIFAGGCFWCMEPPFERLDGVIEVVSGYTGGYKDNPSYEEVSGGVSGHQEAIQITYDQSKVTYEHLLDAFWMQIDPTDQGGQFADRGEQYKTAIFYFNDKQKEAAEFSKMRLGQSGRFDGPIVTKIIPASKFYTAEGYHQDYYKKNSAHYKRYSAASGREGCLQEKWGGSMKEDGMKGVYNKPDDAELRKMLTPLQYKVAREDGTERAFDNEYWDNKEVGIYVDIVSGEPLFISTDKFVSGTGWPSFAKPLEAGNIAEKEDRSLFRVRTEVRSLHGDSHLGHVFKDGPEPLGLRYCINSASLRFIPKNNLEKEGYGLYNELFE